VKKTGPHIVRFRVEPFPHIFDSDSTPKMMWTLSLSLFPVALAACFIRGTGAAWILFAATGTAVLSEILFNASLAMRSTVKDGSAFATGLLLGLSLPFGVPWWMPVLGAFTAVVLAKQAFGGLGANPVNPALFGRLFLMLIRPGAFWSGPGGIDGLTSATPLTKFRIARVILSNSSVQPADRITDATVAVSGLYGSFADGSIVRLSACLGETSLLLLLFAAGFLLYRRVIGWKIPLAMLGSSGLLFWIFGGAEGILSGNPFFHLSQGGLVFAACFMATDPVTSPVRAKDRLIFGAGCGILTVIFRLWGPHPEGVAYAVLIMNLIHTVHRRRWVRSAEREYRQAERNKRAE
jgi:Na+-translocating ferredoxin:NAD+ oxidoreductase subunit D